MSIIIRLQNLSWAANSLDIRRFFDGLGIPEGGVHIVGGEKGDAFIAFLTDEDARQAMERDGGKIKDARIKLLLSSRAEMQKVIELARSGFLLGNNQSASQVSKVAPTPTKESERKRGSPEKSRSRDKDKERNGSSSKKAKKRDSRSRSRSPRRSSNRDREKEREKDRDKDREKDRDKDKDRKDRDRDGNRRNDKSKRDDRRRSEETKAKDDNSHSSGENGDSSSRPSVVPNTNSVLSHGLPSDLALVGSGLSFGSLFPIVKPADLRQGVIQGMDRMMDPSFATMNSINHFGLEGNRLSLEPQGLALDSTRLGVLDNRLMVDNTMLMDSARLGMDANRLMESTRLGMDANRLMESTRLSMDANRLMDSNRLGMDANRLAVDVNRLDANRMGFDNGASRVIDMKRNPPVWQENAPIGILMGPTAANTTSLNNESFRDLDVLNNPRQMQTEKREEKFDRFGKTRVVPEKDPRFSEPERERFGPRRNRDENSQFAESLPSARPTRFSDVNEADTRRPRPESVSLELRGLPATANYKDIREFFRGFTIITDGIKIINDELGHRTGKAFVRFGDERDSKTALMRKHNSMMNNKRIEIIRCPERVYDEAVDSFVPQTKNPLSMFPHCLQPRKEDFVVVMKGLPFASREEDIVQFFDGLNILDVFVEYEPGGTRATGTAFVEFGTPKDMHMAMTMDGRQMGHRKIRMLVGSKEMITAASQARLANTLPRHRREQMQGPPPPDEAMHQGKPVLEQEARNDVPCLIMRNLPQGVTNNDISNFFAESRIVPAAIHIMLNPNGEPNGDAFVELSGVRDVEPSLRKNGEFIGRQPVNIQPIPFERMRTILGLPRAPAGNVSENDMKRDPRVNDGMRGPPINDNSRAERRVLMDSPPIGPMREETEPPKDGIRPRMGEDRSGLMEREPRQGSMGRDGRSGMMDRDGRPSMINDNGMRMGDNRLGMDRFGNDLSNDGENMKRPMNGPSDNMPMDMDFVPDDMGPMPFSGPPRGPMGPFNGPSQRFPFGMMGPRGPNGPFPHMGPRMGGPRLPGGPSGENFGKPGCVVGLSNIPFRATIDEVIQFFAGFDLRPENVIRRYDQFGRATGDARVALLNPEEAKRAMKEFNGKYIHNRMIQIFLL